MLRSADTDTFFSYDDIAAEDEFERRRFSDRLARIIINEPGGKPLVVSIVNPWGGGKSTILQYVMDAVAATTYEESSCIKHCRITSFNLWRYAGEDQLLYRMFECLVRAINEDAPLTTGQRLLKLLPAWMKRVSIVCDWLAPGTGALLDGFFATISPEQFEVHLDEVRRNTREHLSKTGIRVIMLLDDVDRLDPDEILLLFRALKLIADLPNTTFIIAMDEEHVSEVIGQRIGSTAEAGRRYIEKIVNVRLAVPKIPDDVLEDYVIRRFIAVWQRQRSQVPPMEVERMRGIFRVLHLPHILTPRTVKSIENAFAFALGLLPDEVDGGDVLLLEATRLLHPKLYLALPQVIPNLNRLLYRPPIEAMMDEKAANERTRAEKAKLVTQLCALIETPPFSPKDQIEEALKTWFPQLREFSFPEEEKRNEQAKRISSPDYFWRYYAGAVHKRDIHDAEVSAWLALALNPEKKAKAIETLVHHLRQPYLQAFIKKLGDLLPPSLDSLLPLTLIAEAVSALPAEDPDPLKSLWHKAASVISAVIHQVADLEQQIEMATAVVQASKNLQWSFVFYDYVATNSYLTPVTKQGEMPQSPSAFDEELARRSLQAYEEGFVPQANDLICKMVWSIFRNPHLPDLKKRVRSLAEANPSVALQLLVGGCDFGSSESHQAACWRWKGHDGIRNIENLVPRSILEKALKKALPAPTASLRQPTSHSDYFTLQEVGWAYFHDIRSQGKQVD